MRKETPTPNWMFDWANELPCLSVLEEQITLADLGPHIEELLEKHIDDDLYDLDAALAAHERDVRKQLKETTDATVSAELENALNEVASAGHLLFQHLDDHCHCIEDAWEAAEADWEGWLEDRTPPDATSWYLLETWDDEPDFDFDEWFVLERRFDADFLISEVTREFFIEGSGQYEVQHDAERRILTLIAHQGHRSVKFRLYCPTPQEEALLEGKPYEVNSEGFFTFLANKGDRRQLALLDDLSHLPGADEFLFYYYRDAAAHVQELLASLPEQAHDHLYELAGNWDGTEDQLRATAFAHTLPPAHRPRFLAAVEAANYPQDLHPYVETAPTPVG